MQILATHWSVVVFVVLIAFVTTGVVSRISSRSASVSKGRPQSMLSRLLRLPRTMTINALNGLVFLFSGGKRVLHVGHFRSHLRSWINWNRTVTFRPHQVAFPVNEHALSQCLQQQPTSKVRIVGSGHSFNDSATSQELLISLTHYRLDTGAQWKLLGRDAKGGLVRVAAGMRLRDLTHVLCEAGLAVPVLGSADAQTLGGLMATDVHGTGRDHGFLSEQVVSMRIMNALGEAQEFRRDATSPEERDTFQAALSGLGACGIITELTLRCVPHFNLEKTSEFKPRAEVEGLRDTQGSLDTKGSLDTEDLLNTLVEAHPHVSLYEMAGASFDHIRVNIWKPTSQPLHRRMHLRRMRSELMEFLISGFLFECAFAWVCKRKLITTFVYWLFKVTRQEHKRIVQPAGIAFTRTLYFLHDELEYGVPYDKYRKCMKELREMLERERFMTLIEVRFTPHEAKTVALIGPGGEGAQRTCFIGLTPTLSYGRKEIDRVFTLAADILQRHDGQVHLGKNMSNVNESRMQQMHKERFQRFQQVRNRQDPSRRFSNAFTDRVLGP